MKIRCILLLTVILSLSEMYAQEGKEDMTRHNLQQMIIEKNFITDHPKLNIETADQLDSLFLAAEVSWRKYVDDSITSTSLPEVPLEVLSNIDSYSYWWFLASITGKWQHSEEIESHLLKHYMLPALLKDLNSLQKNITIQSNKLIWRGSLVNTIGMGLNYYQDKEVIDNLYVLMTELEKLLTESIQTMDEEEARYSIKLLNSLKEFEYDIKAKYYFANQQEDKAFVNFITGVSTNQYLVSNIYPFSEALIGYFSEKGAKDKSFTILNNVIFSTSSDEIPRDSLKTWYYAVDSLRGAELYEQASRKLDGKLLSISDVALSTSPKEWNYIANGLPNEKLQKAKYVLIDFWYTGCKPCIEEIPELNDLHNKLKGRDDVVFVSINTDHFRVKRDKDFTSRTIKKHRIEFPVVFDSDSTNISKELNILGYPTKKVVNSKGQVLEKVGGSRITLSTFTKLLSAP